MTAKKINFDHAYAAVIRGRLFEIQMGKIEIHDGWVSVQTLTGDHVACPLGSLDYVIK